MNSDSFIEYYNKIDKYLKDSEKFETYETFSQKIKNSNNKIVLRFKDELISLGELRNAIVHNPKIGDKAIAEPHDSTLDRIKFLHEEITKPKKVIPTFQFEVLGAEKDDFINDILVKMRQKSFSQFPVYDSNGHVIELINTNTISRWLSENLEENGSILTEDVKVRDLLSEIEFKENYKFISRNTSVYEAYEIFLEFIFTEKRNLDVLLITYSGKKTEKLLGLIAIEDIVSEIKK